ncbi:hypothetical protein BKA62DRAFT_238059 [Auriculariales sp. MPI-PUGE-AT-0066]|nr:hypothetical protein BKA62DRAFT_238059 [Auriculariales sp. MPI-PUGE-AT-0066]
MVTATVSPTSAMLPSFVELMASLGLESNDTDPHPTGHHQKGHRATASFSSISSVSTTLSTPHTASSPAFPIPSSPVHHERRTILKKRSAARFSPYAPEIVHGQRLGLPGSQLHNPFAVDGDANSAPSSPRSRSPSYRGRDSNSPPRSVDTDVPRISRARRSPYPSPNSATFGFHTHGHQRNRSSANSSPEQLALPILPPMPLPIVASANYDRLMALDDNHVTISIAQRRRHVPQGLRISTFRNTVGTGGPCHTDGRRAALLAHDPPMHTS